jgi:hypothetical protein
MDTHSRTYSWETAYISAILETDSLKMRDRVYEVQDVCKTGRRSKHLQAF